MSRNDDEETHPIAELLEAVLAPRPAYADTIEASRADRLRALHIETIAGVAERYLSRLEVPCVYQNWEHTRTAVFWHVSPQLVRKVA
jgi:hypothetical protein